MSRKVVVPVVIIASGAIIALFVVVMQIRQSPKAPAGPGSATQPAQAISIAIEMPTTASTNAADSYREASRLMQLLQADGREEAAIGRYEEGEFDANAGAFFERHAAIVGWVRRGATLADCDWGAPPMERRLTSLNDARTIANFTLTHADFAAGQGDIDAAVNDLIAVLTMAKHIGADPMLVSKLVEIGEEIAATRQLATILPSMSQDQLKSLKDRLAALPPATTGAQLMAGELAFSRQSIRDQNAGAVMIAMADSLEPLYTKLGEAMDAQPPDEFVKIADEELSHYSMNLIAKSNVASFKAAATTIAAQRVNRAMLETAIEILLKGESAVADSAEPFSGEPFGYTKTPGGFILKSKIEQRGTPVTLTVGQ